MEAFGKESMDSFLRVIDREGVDSNCRYNWWYENRNNSAALAAAPDGPGETDLKLNLIERVKEESEKVTLVLRSKGRPLHDPASTENHPQSLPPFIVGLAHYHQTDVFLLFVFTSQTLPCRLVRFNRDGKEIRNSNNEDDEDCAYDRSKSFLWSIEDAGVLASAVNRCKTMRSSYFEKDATTAMDREENHDINEAMCNSEGLRKTKNPLSDADSSSRVMDGRNRAEYIRLVPQIEKKSDADKQSQVSEDDSDDEESARVSEGEEGTNASDSEGSDSDSEQSVDEGNRGDDEAKSIRSIIVNELLNPQGAGGVDFQHPNPDFLLPLSRSIHNELRYWRNLCKIMPLASDKPEFPSCTVSDKDHPGEEEISDFVNEDFKEIISRRTAQFKQSVGLCQGSLKRIETNLSAMINDGNSTVSTTYQLGKECVASLAALEHLQRQHHESWHEYHSAIGEVTQDMYDYGENYDERVLKPWLENGDVFTYNLNVGCNPKRGEDKQDREDVNNPKCVNSAYDAAKELVLSWENENQHLILALSSAVLAVEKSMTTWDKQGLHIALNNIQSAQRDVEGIMTKAKRVTKASVTKLAKLWNVPSSDDEGKEDKVKPWLQDAVSQWTIDEVEAHFSFGCHIYDGEEHTRMSFALDHVALTDSIDRCMQDLVASLERDYRKPMEALNCKWDKMAKETIDSALEDAKSFLDSRDLLHASHVIACCYRVLCDDSFMEKLQKSIADERYGSDCTEKIIHRKLLNTMSKLDICIVKIALAYFDPSNADTLIADKSTAAGAHWLYEILRSGALYFPSKGMDIKWKENESSDGREPLWDKYSHPAAAVFEHGWKHPVICSTIKDQENLTSRLSDIEAPVVIKERFHSMKSQGNTQAAIALALMTSGDQDCMHFLFSCGLGNEAIVQASSSLNLEGLVKLSEDLLPTNPRASILCMHAHILGSLEEGQYMKVPSKSIDNFVDIFRKKWLMPSDAEEIDDSVAISLSNVPSFRILSTISVTRTFLDAAKSTIEMQSLLESKNFAESGASLTITAIAIIVRAMVAREAVHYCDSIEYFLDKTSLLSVSADDKIRYSGLLTKIGEVPAFLGKKTFLDICCALYESAKYLIEIRCNSVFCFDLALFSATNIAYHTGCQTFALQVLHSMRNLDDGMLPQYSIVSPMNSISACFSSLFSSKCTWCPQIRTSLLDTFFILKNSVSSEHRSKLINEDVVKSRIWMSIASLQHQDADQAAALLVDDIILTRSTNTYSTHYSSDYMLSRSEDVFTNALHTLSTIDEDDDNVNAYSTEGGDTSEPYGHTMLSFKLSPNRRRITETERANMTSAFIDRLLAVSDFLSVSTITKCVKLHFLADPSFWSHGVDEVQQRVSHLTGLVLTLSKKKSLFHTSSLMFYIDESIRRGETWCNRLILLELGLSWIRNALLPSQNDIVQFDNADTPSKWQYQELEEDHTNIFGRGHFEHSGSPKLAAKVLIAVLQASLPVLKDDFPQLSDICGEALALCKVLDFLLQPAQQRLDAIVATQNALGLWQEQFPSHLRPDSLVTFVVDVQWSAKPDLSLSFSDSNESLIPFLVPRIACAIRYGKIVEAAALCLTGNTKRFWTNLSDAAGYAPSVWPLHLARKLLQSCLLILKAAVGSDELSKEFVNFALHLILSMGWFRGCWQCAHGGYSHEYLVSIKNIAALHEIALRWNRLLDEKRESTCAPFLTYCMNVIGRLSRCIHCYDENNSYTECQNCGHLDEDYGYSSSSDELQQNKGSAREQRAKLRMKRKWQNQSPDDIELDFKELQLVASQLHMKKTSDWYYDALKTINSSRPRKKKKILNK